MSPDPRETGPRYESPTTRDVDPYDEDMLCICFLRTRTDVAEKIREMNLRTVNEVTRAIGIGLGCGACRHDPDGIAGVLRNVWGVDTDEPAD